MHTALSAGVSVSPAFLLLDGRVAVRHPRPVLQLYNLSNTLTGLTWIVFYVTVLALCLAMAGTFAFYKEYLPFLNRGREVKISEFLIRPLAAITEPEPINWFQKNTTDTIMESMYRIVHIICWITRNCF